MCNKPLELIVYMQELPATDVSIVRNFAHVQFSASADMSKIINSCNKHPTLQSLPYPFCKALTNLQCKGSPAEKTQHTFVAFKLTLGGCSADGDDDGVDADVAAQADVDDDVTKPGDHSEVLHQTSSHCHQQLLRPPH